MEIGYRDTQIGFSDSGNTTSEAYQPHNEFPSPNPFQIRAGRSDACAYSRNLGAYVAMSKSHSRHNSRRHSNIFANNSRNSHIFDVRKGAIIFALIAIISLVFLTAGGLAAMDKFVRQSNTSAPSVLASGNVDAVSTPQTEWKRGTIPVLYQIDPQWASAAYGGDRSKNERGTIATFGCGPTCLSMVYIGLTGKTDKSPLEMAKFAEDNGFVEEGLTSWALMTKGASQLGLTSEQIPAFESKLMQEASAGHPIICSVGPGDFAKTGHFIVITGVADDGKLVVHDPNSPERSGKTWTADRILSQSRNLWSFTV